MTRLTNILVPLDGSELAERALPPALALAQKHDAQLVIVRAAEAHTLPGTDQSEPQISAVNEAEEYLSTMATRLNIPSDRLQTAVPYGETTSSILLEIQLRKADLVVMSTHGRNGIGRAVQIGRAHV